MRTLNELYVLLLEEYEKQDIFKALCGYIRLLTSRKFFTDNEYYLLRDSIRENRPNKSKEIHGYWFNSKQERIDFLKQMIEITKKE